MQAISVYLYLITFQSSLNRIESVYDCHKDLFVEIEKFFTLHLVPYTEAASMPADAYRMAFIASGGVEKMVTQHFELLPYPIPVSYTHLFLILLTISI